MYVYTYVPCGKILGTHTHTCTNTNTVDNFMHDEGGGYDVLGHTQFCIILYLGVCV